MALAGGFCEAATASNLRFHTERRQRLLGSAKTA
jgi:hypothetical protein